MDPNFEGQVMERFLICKNPICRFVIDLRTKENQIVPTAVTNGLRSAHFACRRWM